MNLYRIKIIHAITFITFLVISIASCAAENENITNLPKINGFDVERIYKLNRNILAAYMDPSGNSLVFKFDESSATWKRILFKTKVSFND